jgi:hypothetical protein
MTQHTDAILKGSGAHKDIQFMQTELRIPSEPAPEDPLWMTKKFSGKTLSAAEQEEYYRWQHELNLNRLK